jgi:hypothetical protein
MAERIETSPSEVKFGATDVRLTSCTEAWAALARRQQGLDPLPSDEDVLLLTGIDLMTGSEPSPGSRKPVGAQVDLPVSCRGNPPGPAEPMVQDPTLSEPSLSWGDLMDLEDEKPVGSHPIDQELQDLLAGPTDQSADPRPARQPKQKPFVCTACPRAFGERRRLLAHWESSHDTSYMGFTCPEAGCKKTFHQVHVNMLKIHLRKDHKKKNEALAQLLIDRKPRLIQCQNSDRKALTVSAPQDISVMIHTSRKRKMRQEKIHMQDPAPPGHVQSSAPRADVDHSLACPAVLQTSASHTAAPSSAPAANPRRSAPAPAVSAAGPSKPQRQPHLDRAPLPVDLKDQAMDNWARIYQEACRRHTDVERALIRSERRLVAELRREKAENARLHCQLALAKNQPRQKR